jgi:hypothetical protein
MLKNRIRTAHTATIKSETPHRKLPRHITGRRLGKKAVALAMAPTGAAAITLTGLAITAPGASAAGPCINQTFSISDQYTYEQCVAWEQLLLDDLYTVRAPGPNQRLTIDGHYGPHTSDDVAAFNAYYHQRYGSTTTPATWWLVCNEDDAHGFHGAYWQDAGCAADISG